MSSFASLIICMMILNPSTAQNEEYTCLPCGYACDATTHHGPGTCPSCGMSLVKTSSITFETLDFSGLCKRLQANPSLILLDVRTKEEFANDHPPVEALGRFRGAMNININDLPERVNELAAYKDKEIIVYCSHSHRSPRASYYLSTHGFSKVSNVSIGVSYFSTQPVPSCLRDRFIQFPAPAR